MENKKYVLVLIIVLLVIFVPLTVTGFIINFSKTPSEENPNHELFYEGNIWFYKDNELLNKYECKSEICDFAKFTIDDAEYGINYYKDGTQDKLTYKGSSHTIITDGDETFLLDIKNNRDLIKVEGIKTYNTNLSNNMYIIKSNGKWGVISISNNGDNDFRTIIPIEYDFIGIKNNELVEDTLNVDLFIVKKDNEWYLMNVNKSLASGIIESPIIDYNNNYLVSKDANNYLIYNIDGERYYENYQITNYALMGEYSAIVVNNSLAVFKNNELLNSYAITDLSAPIDMKIEEDNLVIKLSGNVVGTIAIS